MSEALINSECPTLNLLARGKVRDVYEVDEASLLFVATDRISAFDVVMKNGIPGKGKILTQLSLYWFDLLKDLGPNHLITANLDEMPASVQEYRDQLEGCSMLVKRLEILPVDLPSAVHVPIELPVARQMALDHRPEIDNLLEQIQAASVRLNVARNQVLPMLNLILDTYVNGLTGNYELGRSYGNQYSAGAPSYTAGLVFEVPLGNRRARAAERQRQLELAKLTSELRAATAVTRTAVLTLLSFMVIMGKMPAFTA